MATSKEATILVDADEAARLLSISLRSFHDLRKQDRFPLPIRLGPRCTRWVRAELEVYVTGLPRGAGEMPPQLAAALAKKNASAAEACAPACIEWRD